jgi:hypothetical protein
MMLSLVAGALAAGLLGYYGRRRIWPGLARR